MEQLLSILPILLSYWNGVLLAWGCYIMFMYYRTIKQQRDLMSRGIRNCDIIILTTSGIANVVIFSFLFLIPQQFLNLFGDAIIVIDTWYTLFLAYGSLGVYQWLKHRRILRNLPILQ